MTLLELAGGFVIGVIVGIGATLLYIRHQMKSQLMDIEEHMGEMMDMGDEMADMMDEGLEKEKEE